MKNPPNNDRKTLRGGSWFGSQDYVRCAYRFRNGPAHFSLNLGFRMLEELNNDRKAICGGSWLFALDHARADDHLRYPPYLRDVNIGFRLLEMTRNENQR